MGDFLHTYSTYKYSTEPLQMEFTYNFSAGLDRLLRRQHMEAPGFRRSPISGSSGACCSAAQVRTVLLGFSLPLPGVHQDLHSLCIFCQLSC